MPASISPSVSPSISPSFSPGDMEYALVIAKKGATGAVEQLAVKDRAFDSRYACLKILQADTASAVSATEVTLDSSVAFPVVILLFQYVDATGEYSPIEASFDSTKLYLPGGGASGDTYHYFICYA